MACLLVHEEPRKPGFSWSMVYSQPRGKTEKQKRFSTCYHVIHPCEQGRDSFEDVYGIGLEDRIVETPIKVRLPGSLRYLENQAGLPRRSCTRR
jgi:hypothetical protein